MIKTVIVIPEGEVMPDGVVSAYFFLSQANAYSTEQHKPPIFDLSIAGKSATNWLYHGLFGIKSIPLSDLSGEIDLVVVPGFLGEKIPIEENSWLIDWLHEQYFAHQTELASMCTGAFLLAAAGVLDGKKCTTHWAFKEAFSALFPKTMLEVDKIVTDHARVYTSAGAFSSLNLLLYLVEKFADKETAIWLSKVFQVDIQRKSQRPFMILNQLYHHEDSTIKALQEYMELHYQKELLIADLAEDFALSTRTLVRRFKKATGISPSEYLQQVRIEAAKRMLESEDKTVDEVIFQTGYKDPATFRKVFKKLTGLPPNEYRHRYRR